MNRLIVFLLVVTVVNCSKSIAQNPNMPNYDGDWESKIHPLSFSCKIGISSNNEFKVSLSNYQKVFDEKITSTTSDKVSISFLEVYDFTGRFNKDKSKLEEFLKIRNDEKKV
ncbi:MAG: hypothetical protein AB8B74_07570 [Crocinitomicaceae bacterium]